VVRRTTIELDEDLVAEARAALGQMTVRGTVEEALRRAIEAERSADRAKRVLQIEALSRASKLIDHEVLISGEAWR
jgi:Arc/MetJ family transcription regulator